MGFEAGIARQLQMPGQDRYDVSNTAVLVWKIRNHFVK